MRKLSVRHERWPLAGKFTISRGSRTAAEVVVAEIADDEVTGRGECVPYARYGETVEGVVAAIETLAAGIAADMDRDGLQEALSSGAARNALDCALWDYEAKARGTPVWQLAGLSAPQPVTTAFTLSLDTPEAMARAAREHAHRPVLKMKLAGEGDLERVGAVCKAAPGARLIVDANEGWTEDMVAPFGAELARLGVEMIEQPLPADADSVLAGLPHPVPFFADESCHDRSSLADIVGKYDGINIKLDKTGGLSEALALKRDAEAAGLRIMVGCMVATSLAMAPAVLLAQDVDIVDLDGPLLLARDREQGLQYAGSEIVPPGVALWG